LKDKSLECTLLGHAVAQLVSDTCRRVAGSIPDGFIAIFIDIILSGCTMALGLTQLLTEMSTRYISRDGKATGAYG
jgi:hypothetical protein